MLTNERKAQLNELALYDEHRAEIVATNQSAATKVGFLFEQVQATDFNCEAIEQDSPLRAYTDRSRNTPLRRNDPLADIVICDGLSMLATIQAKARTPQNTYKSMCSPEQETHRPPYSGASMLLCTQEAKNYLYKELFRRLAKEKYRADNGQSRLLAIANYSECLTKITDRIAFGGVETMSWSLENLFLEVEAPYYTDSKLMEVHSAICAESWKRNLSACYGGGYALSAALGSYLGDRTESFGVVLHDLTAKTGCAVNAAVNGGIQTGFALANGVLTGQRRKQIAGHVLVGAVAAVANGFISNTKCKEAVAAVASLFHQIVDCVTAEK